MFKVSFYSLFNLLSDFPFLLSVLLVVILKKVVFYKSPNPPSAPFPPKHTHIHTSIFLIQILEKSLNLSGGNLPFSWI